MVTVICYQGNCHYQMIYHNALRMITDWSNILITKLAKGESPDFRCTLGVLSQG